MEQQHNVIELNCLQFALCAVMRWVSVFVNGCEW